MILFLFAIVFIAELIITGFIIIKLVDIDLAIIELDEKLQAERNIVKYSMYYFKEVTAAYKELVKVTFQNIDKKYRKFGFDRIKSTLVSLFMLLIPKTYRKFIDSTKLGYKVVRYLSKA